MKKVSYEDLISRCKDLQKIAVEDDNKHDQKLYDTIYKMLTSCNIFKQLPAETCLNVLYDLQFSLEEGNEIYQQLFAKD